MPGEGATDTEIPRAGVSVQKIFPTSVMFVFWNILFKSTCLGFIGILPGFQGTSDIKDHMAIMLAFPAPVWCLCCLFLKFFLQVRGVETFPHQTPDTLACSFDIIALNNNPPPCCPSSVISN